MHHPLFKWIFCWCFVTRRLRLESLLKRSKTQHVRWWDQIQSKVLEGDSAKRVGLVDEPSNFAQYDRLSWKLLLMFMSTMFILSTSLNVIYGLFWIGRTLNEQFHMITTDRIVEKTYFKNIMSIKKRKNADRWI